MNFTWDESKRLRNIGVHGLDFADVEDAFDFDSALIVAAKRPGAGAPRFKAIGRLQDLTVALIFSLLGTEAVALITLRPASKKERTVFDEH